MQIISDVETSHITRRTLALALYLLIIRNDLFVHTYTVCTNCGYYLMVAFTFVWQLHIDEGGDCSRAVSICSMYTVGGI